MITSNHILLAIFIEIALSYLAVYSILKANRWVEEKQELVDELLYALPYKAIEFRESLSVINEEIDDNFKIKPLEAKELGFLVGSIVSVVIKLKFQGGGLFKNKFALLSLATKLWSYRKRLFPTLVKFL